MNKLSGIRDFLQLNESLATSGMPQPDDFAALRDSGFDTVINLAMPTSDNAMPNEGDLVTRAGMTYIHIPVNFELPQSADFTRFSRLMDTLEGHRVYVHCAANKRVSAFVFLHRVLRDGKTRPEAESDLRRIWNPAGAWRDFVNQHLRGAGQQPLS